MTVLRTLPAQPDGVDFPGIEWPTGESSMATQAAIEALFVDPEQIGETRALALIQGGKLIYERYAAEYDANSTFASWSMAKSFMAVLTGMLVADGLLDLDAPVPVPEWASDSRSAITLENLLKMRSGLQFVEHDDDPESPNCIQMLHGEGKKNVVAYATRSPMVHPPGSVWNYSSGDVIIIAKIAGDALGGPEQLVKYLQSRLLDPLGMASAIARCDETGIWVASTFLYASARDFARFGLLLLRGGLWGDQQLVAKGWIDRARTSHVISPRSGLGYGEQLWIYRDERGSFGCQGDGGQHIKAVPSSDVVLVRLGKTERPLRRALAERIDRVIETLD